MEAIKKTFAQCRKESRPAFVTYVTAGYPTAEETVAILLAMEAGGAGASEPPIQQSKFKFVFSSIYISTYFIFV